MTFKRSCYLAILLLLILTTAACGKDSNSQNSSSKQEVKVALSAEVNPPYLYTNKKNEFVGLDMDYMKLLEKNYLNMISNMKLAKRNLI